MEREVATQMLLTMLPTNSSYEYKGATSYMQLLDGIEEASKFAENVVCVIHTDGLLDAHENPNDRQSDFLNQTRNRGGEVGRQQLCERLGRLDLSKSNFSKFILQFAVHTEADVVRAFTRAFSDVCVKIIGKSLATHTILNTTTMSTAAYAESCQVEMIVRRYKIEPQFI